VGAGGDDIRIDVVVGGELCSVVVVASRTKRRWSLSVRQA
jgi:hypothetical protein